MKKNFNFIFCVYFLINFIFVNKFPLNYIIIIRIIIKIIRTRIINFFFFFIHIFIIIFNISIDFFIIVIFFIHFHQKFSQIHNFQYFSLIQTIFLLFLQFLRLIQILHQTINIFHQSFIHIHIQRMKFTLTTNVSNSAVNRNQTQNVKFYVLIIFRCQICKFPGQRFNKRLPKIFFVVACVLIEIIIYHFQF